MTNTEKALVCGVVAGLWVMSTVLAFVLLCQAAS